MGAFEHGPSKGGFKLSFCSRNCVTYKELNELVENNESLKPIRFKTKI